MVANRTLPTLANTPGGISGADYAARVAEEFLAALVGRINNVSSIGGSANAITGVCTPPLTAAPQTGETFRLVPGANNSGAVTVNLDSTGAIALRDEDGAALNADDIVNGRPIVFWYNGTHHRLGNPSLQAILATLAGTIAAAERWEVIDDTTISSPTGTVEHAFVANSYTKIVSIVTGASFASNAAPRCTLRHSGGAIVTLDYTNIDAANFGTFDAEFLIDVTSASSKVHLGFARDSTAETRSQNGNATAPDRIRWTDTTAAINFDAGRFITYGLKVP